MVPMMPSRDDEDEGKDEDEDEDDGATNRLLFGISIFRSFSDVSDARYSAAYFPHTVNAVCRAACVSIIETIYSYYASCLLKP